MKTINKDDYYKQFAVVSVNDMIWATGAKCQKCKDKVQEFTVFVGNGQKMSTMYSSCCPDCLPTVIKEAIDYGRKQANEQYKAAEQRLYKESLEYVRKTKLNEIQK